LERQQTNKPKERAMKHKQLYGGIDLHSNNNLLAVVDQMRVVRMSVRLPNRLDAVLGVLEPMRRNIVGLAVESTFNWYWLVDGLMEAGYRVHLGHPPAFQQYKGLKHTDDRSDARWLAEMLMLGLLPEGYIYPKENRALRDLHRKRMRLVQQRTRNMLSLHSMLTRHLGDERPSLRIFCKLDESEVDGVFGNEDVALSAKSNLAVYRCLGEEITRIEKTIRKRLDPCREWQLLKTVDGIGDILASTIWLEVGDIHRFAHVGNFASYCRCVRSEKESNKKVKGQGNRKNGNKYLSWAFAEAANYAIRYNPAAKRYYERKAAKTNRPLARRALAHKLARVCYFIMRDHVRFDTSRLFG
jgi:transposase